MNLVLANVQCTDSKHCLWCE